MAGLDLTRLPQAWREARRDSERLRQVRRRAVSSIAGNNFTTTEDKIKHVNITAKWFNVIHRATFPSNLRLMLTAHDNSQESAVKFSEQWINDEYKRQNLNRVYKRITADGLIGMGICKVAIASAYEAAIHGFNIDAGTPFPYRIDQDDWAMDPMARDYAESQWMMHRIRVPVDLIREDKEFSKHRKNLKPTTQQESHRDANRPITDIAHESIPDGEFREMTDIWEVYFPADECVYIIWGDDLANGATSSNGIIPTLKEMKWVGPDTGPYIFNGHTWLPGTQYPKPPVCDILDLDDATNAVYRKLVDQARTQKNIVVGTDEKALEAYAKAKQGGTVFLPPSAMNELKEISTLGPTQGLYMIAMEFIKRSSWMGDNFEVAGGLASQANTATQEEMLNENAGGQLAEIRENNIEFVRRCSESMLWYQWNNPDLTMMTKWEVPGMPDKHARIPVHPWDYPGKGLKRTGKAPLIDVDPYTAGPQTPQRRVREMMDFLKMVFPLLGQAQQQGHAFDFGFLTEAVSRYMDNPDIARLFNVQDPPQMEESGSGSSGPTKPQETTREVLRTSPGNGSKPQGDMPSAQAWAGSLGKL